MTLRFAFALVAAALAAASSPSLAQRTTTEPAALSHPPATEAPAGTGIPRSSFAYSPEQRATWLDQCRAVYPQACDPCATYLTRYEQAYFGQLSRAR